MTNKELKGYNSLHNDKIFASTKLEAFADNKINVANSIISLFGKGRKHYGKRRKCCLPAFSPFPSMFASDQSTRYVKPQHCVVKRYDCN